MSLLRFCPDCRQLWEPTKWQLKHGHAKRCTECAQPDPRSSKEYKAARKARVAAVGLKCECCGAEDRIEAHHRDGNPSHNPPDGSNLELLCRPCHRTTFGKAATERPSPMQGETKRAPAGMRLA